MELWARKMAAAPGRLTHVNVDRRGGRGAMGKGRGGEGRGEDRGRGLSERLQRIYMIPTHC